MGLQGMSRSIWAGAIAVMLMASLAQAQPPSTSASASAAGSQRPNLSTPGSGDISLSNPHAIACEAAAKRGDATGAGAGECTQALASTTEGGLAAIFTDRGSVYLQHKQWAQAKSDFDVALKLDPTTADAYIDRGAADLGLKQYADAIADIDRGLALGPDQPEKAYFNRAIADEHLDDLKAAYQDYLRASELNPNWALPKEELARFSR
jgi:tetratricopeptide (TPR) repeat protein